MFRSILSFRKFNMFCFSNIKYTKSHQWVEYLPGNQIARVGITDHAQEALGQIIHVEFPSKGKIVKQGESTVVIESVKIAADVYSPISGQIIAVNDAVAKDASLVNKNAEKQWLYEIKLSGKSIDLITKEQYLQSLKNQSH